MKSLFYTGFTALVLFFNGCGSDAGACRFEIETLMKEGDFIGSIEKLENDTTCQSAYPEGEYHIYLGLSYMGKAGLGFTDVVASAVDAINRPQGFLAAFIEESAAKRSTTALSDLNNAKINFEAYLDTTECDSPSLTIRERDVCLNLGIASLSNAAVVFDYLSDDIPGWVNGTNIDEMQASACALEYAVNIPSTYSYICSNTLTLTRLNEVIFDDNRSYELVQISDYFYLVSQADTLPGTLASTVLTDGLCSTDYNTTTATPDGLINSYPCPLSSEVVSSTATLLHETLNTGLNITANVLSDNPELKDRILTFKEELFGYNLGDVTIGDTTVEDISIDKIINYLLSTR